MTTHQTLAAWIRQTPKAATCIALGCATAHAAQLEVFEFDELAGTAVTAAANTGTPGTLAHANSGDNSYETDGNGVAVFTATDPFAAVFRNDPLFAPAATSGEVFLRVDFAGHSLASSATTKTFGYGFRDSATASNLILRLNKNNSDSVRIDVFDGNNAGGGNNTSPVNIDYAGLDDTVGVSAILALDLDSDTYDLYTSVGNTGAFAQVLTDVALVNPASIDNLDEFRYQVQSFDPGDTVGVDRVLVADTLADALDGSLVPVDYDFFPVAGGKFLDLNNTDEPANGFTIPGDGTATYNAPGTNLFRTRALASPVLSGKVFLRLDVLDYTSTDTSDDGFQLGLRDGLDNRVSLQFTSNAEDPQKRLRVLPSEGGTSGSPTPVHTTSGLADPFATSAILEIDIDNDTYSAYSGSPGNYTKVNSDIPLNFDIDAIEEIRLGINNMDPGDSLAFDLVIIDDDFDSISNFGAVSVNAELSIVPGPGAGEVTLVWPTSTPSGIILEESTDLGIADDWEEVTDTPAVNGDNYELTIDTSGIPAGYYRLNNP